jgi:hypothetical protein
VAGEVGLIAGVAATAPIADPVVLIVAVRGPIAGATAPIAEPVDLIVAVRRPIAGAAALIVDAHRQPGDAHRPIAGAAAPIADPVALIVDAHRQPGDAHRQPVGAAQRGGPPVPPAVGEAPMRPRPVAGRHCKDRATDSITTGIATVTGTGIGVTATAIIGAAGGMLHRSGWWRSAYRSIQAILSRFTPTMMRTKNGVSIDIAPMNPIPIPGWDIAARSIGAAAPIVPDPWR